MTGAVVLAAGSSTRMGRPKAALRTMGPQGHTFLEAILDTLRAVGITAVRVVIAPGTASIPEAHVVNPDPSAGMLSSMHCGLRALPAGLEAVFVWPVDHPLVRKETVIAMISAFRSAHPPIVVPNFAGRRGHPVLFAASVLPELFAADPRLGARAIVHSHEDRLELAVADRGVIADIDTPEDFARHFKDRSP